MAVSIAGQLKLGLCINKASVKDFEPRAKVIVF